jgi:hypothetical protein
MTLESVRWNGEDRCLPTNALGGTVRDLPDGSSPLILAEQTHGQVNYPILISIHHIVTSSKILAEPINHLALMFGARASHAYGLGSVETISAYDVPISRMSKVSAYAIEMSSSDCSDKYGTHDFQFKVLPPGNPLALPFASEVPIVRKETYQLKSRWREKRSVLWETRGNED